MVRQRAHASTSSRSAPGHERIVSALASSRSRRPCSPRRSPTAPRPRRLRIRLLRRLVMAQEEERRRIARDLHDDLGQRLTALRLVLEGIASERRESPDGITKALEMLAAIDQGVDFIAWELRPAALDELGLTKVLETYVQEWSRHAGVRATFHAAARAHPSGSPGSRSQRLPDRSGSVEQRREACPRPIGQRAAGAARPDPRSRSSKTTASDFIRSRRPRP